MKPVKNSRQSAEGDARFERLVDGELSPEEYRTLVASLDDEPDGWRRCALAFLEAQALAHELTAACYEDRAAVPIREPKRSARGTSGTLKQCLAIAASFLIALAAGIALSEWWRSSGQLEPAPRQHIAGSDELPEQPAELADGRQQPVASARLVLSGPGGVTEAGELPIYEVSGSGPSVDQPGLALPVMLLDELARRGHHVERQQQLVPVDLGDGRRAVIPVESIQITPVSRRAY